MVSMEIVDFEDYIKQKDYEKVGIMLLNGYIPPIQSVLLEQSNAKTNLDKFNEIKDISKKTDVFNQYLKDRHYETAKLLLNNGFVPPDITLNSSEYKQFNDFKVISNDEHLIIFLISTPEEQENLFNEYIMDRDYDVIKLILKNGYIPTEESLRLASTIPRFQNMDLLIKNVKSPTRLFEKSDIKRDSTFSTIQYIPSGFNDFFCDLELFNWKYTGGTISFLNEISNRHYFKLFSKYLIKKLNIFGKVSLYTNSYSKFERGKKPGCIADVYAELDNYVIQEIKNNNNGPLFYQGIQRELDMDTKIAEKLKSLDYKSVVVDPLNIFEDNTGEFYVFFDPSVYERIKDDYYKNGIDYFFINVRVDFKTLGHYSFIFFDAKKYYVEYYDPHGLLMKDKLKTTLSIALSQMFVNFIDRNGSPMTITNNIETDYIQNNIVGIQQVENTEQDKGFCVVWGNIMLNLKLLNISMNMRDIEKYFIAYCNRKNYSTYEVMLNYAEYMKRIIPLPGIYGNEKFYDMLELFGEIQLRPDERTGPWMDLSEEVI
jgi:hypothetical protein